MRYNSVWPLPCLYTKENLDGQLGKIEEELAEFSIEHFGYQSNGKLVELGIGSPDLTRRAALIEEGVDIITAVVTYMAKCGISDSELDSAVSLVNYKNLQRGYL